MNVTKTKKLFVFVLAALLAFLPLTPSEPLVSVAASDPTTTAAELEAQLNDILSNERLKGTTTGVSVRNADTGEVLYSHFGDLRLHPASNMKLLTSIAALETLGEDYQFITEVLTDGQVSGDVLQGDLYLRGKGDPTLLKEDFDQFAKDLKSKGISKIKGNLIGDDSWYDDVRLSLDLNWSDEPYYTGAQVSALTLSPNEDYDAGTVIVEVYPTSEVGGQAEVRLTPATDYVTIVNKTEMVGANESKSISIEREHGTNNIVIEGKMPLEGSRSRSWVSVWEPTGYAVDVFKKSLEENGISLIGKSEATVGATPEQATVLTSKKSMTLEELLIPFMKLSNNGHGETLTKEMGKVVYGEGSWDKGLKVTKDVVTSLGVDGATILLRDGSGMSHKNMIPAEEISQLLFAVQDKEWYPAFEYSLPVAGDSDRFVGGTLRNRMKEEPAKGNVLAKTGSLTGVSTLSGYVTTVDGEKLVFSVMINNYLGSSVTFLEDEIAKTLVNYTAGE
ncbi:D-alanyl-D-alanine carboxypeptidase/D-alanyl-D-alanine-endopeptidase [Bacillus carboniphilus]|uniref:D-alanyl-D-alanine carboxypeptidase/D-alanyl-D-alanine-endopeptidase n=1 Tax=Bacillus carboniphilus TaxID=86663 RepID=A0ABP3GCV5_9BACI